MEYKYNDEVTLDIPDNVNGHEYAVGFVSCLQKDDDDSIYVDVYCIANTSTGKYRGHELALADRRHVEERAMIGTYNGRLWKLGNKPLHVNEPVFIEFGEFEYNCFKIYTEEDLVKDIELRKSFGVTLDEVRCESVMIGISVMGGEKCKTKSTTRSELHEGYSFCLGVNSDTVMEAKKAKDESKIVYMMNFANIPISMFTMHFFESNKL